MVAVFVALTFLVFILIDILILKSQGKYHPAFASTKVFSKASLFLPADVLLSSGHTWIKLFKRGLVQLGIDEFAILALGKIFINTKISEGYKISKNDILFEANIGNKKLTFKSPLSGEIKTVNNNIINKKIDDPYNDDWILTLAPDNYNEETKTLKSKDEAMHWLKNEFNRLKDFLHLYSAQVELAGVTIADGGNLIEGALTNYDDDVLKKFEEQFLSIQ